MDLLQIFDGDKSHVYIKDFERFIFHKTKNKNKTLATFARVVYSALVVKMYWQSIKSLHINGAQSERLEKGTIEIKNYFKKVPIP